MPDPEKGSFHIPGPKSPSVQVGEQGTMGLTPDAELLLRVQCLERVILAMPIAGWAYANELKHQGLNKLAVQFPWDKN